MSASPLTYDELRLREELELAERAASTPAARSHHELARLYSRRIAEKNLPARADG